MTSKDLFRGDNLRLARLMSGISLQELGERVSTTRQYIHQLETTDKKAPTIDLIKALAYELKVEPSFFSFPIGNQVKEEECHFRKLKSTLVSSRRECAARATLLNMTLDTLEEYLDLPPVNFPQYDAMSMADVESASTKCRKYWNLGEGPIKNMIRVAENAGAIVSTFGEVSEKVDALSLHRNRPIILLNPTKSSPRIRMDIGHEMAHIVLHKGLETGDLETESQANHFASQFILPRQSLIKEYNGMGRAQINWKDVYSIKVKWGISAKAVIYRLNQCGLITPTQFRTANIHLSKTGQSKEEHYDELVSRDMPELLPSSLTLLINTYGKNLGGLLADLNIKAEFLANLTQTEAMILPMIYEAESPANVTRISAYKHAK